MKKNISSAALFIVCLFCMVSCKKKDTPVNISNRVTTYIEDATGTIYHRADTFSLVYDAAGRLTSLASRTGGQFNYQYNSGNYVLNIMNGSHLIIREYFYLNSIPYIDSSFQYNDTNDSSTEKYLYNAANQLVQMKRYQYDYTGSQLYKTTYYTYDNDGNLSSETSTFVSGGNDTKAVYTYTAFVNTIDLGINQYFPNPHKKLVSKLTNLTPTGAVQSYINYTYTFDNYNRVSTETDTDSYGNTVVKKFFY